MASTICKLKDDHRFPITALCSEEAGHQGPLLRAPPAWSLTPFPLPTPLHSAPPCKHGVHTLSPRAWKVQIPAPDETPQNPFPSQVPLPQGPLPIQAPPPTRFLPFPRVHAHRMPTVPGPAGPRALPEAGLGAGVVHPGPAPLTSALSRGVWPKPGRGGFQGRGRTYCEERAAWGPHPLPQASSSLQVLGCLPSLLVVAWPWSFAAVGAHRSSPTVGVVRGERAAPHNDQRRAPSRGLGSGQLGATQTEPSVPQGPPCCRPCLELGSHPRAPPLQALLGAGLPPPGPPGCRPCLELGSHPQGPERQKRPPQQCAQPRDPGPDLSARLAAPASTRGPCAPSGDVVPTGPAFPKTTHAAFCRGGDKLSFDHPPPGWTLLEARTLSVTPQGGRDRRGREGPAVLPEPCLPLSGADRCSTSASLGAAEPPWALLAGSVLGPLGWEKSGDVVITGSSCALGPGRARRSPEPLRAPAMAVPGGRPGAPAPSLNVATPCLPPPGHPRAAWDVGPVREPGEGSGRGEEAVRLGAVGGAADGRAASRCDPPGPCAVGQRGATGGGDSLGSEGPAASGDAVQRLGPVTAPREIKPGLGLGSNPPSQKEADGTPGSTETAASALLIADLQLTCSRDPQTAWSSHVQSHRGCGLSATPPACPSENQGARLGSQDWRLNFQRVPGGALPPYVARSPHLEGRGGLACRADHRQAKLRAEPRERDRAWGALVPEMPPPAPPRPPSCMARGREGRGETVQAPRRESLARAPPHLDLAEPSCCPRQGLAPCAPISSTLGGPPSPPVGPRSCPGTASWALKSHLGSSGAGPGPSPHPTALCSGSRQPDFWEVWGGAPKPQPSPACRSSQHCKEAPGAEPPRSTLTPTRPAGRAHRPPGSCGETSPPCPPAQAHPAHSPAPPPAPGQVAQGCRPGRVRGVLGAPPSPSPSAAQPLSVWTSQPSRPPPSGPQGGRWADAFLLLQTPSLIQATVSGSGQEGSGGPGPRAPPAGDGARPPTRDVQAASSSTLSALHLRQPPALLCDTFTTGGDALVLV
ncbi:collagen alpha-1(I) chain-like [Muntiacus reevesi]|uniref:collagen alpha-1(I) chain-like n=1 Tax=Muntiacus reevesi TaxID=9886 RepID=UPI003306D41F